eukprot:628022-Heterocapsa_arctica.AAC.1
MAMLRLGPAPPRRPPQPSRRPLPAFIRAAGHGVHRADLNEPAHPVGRRLRPRSPSHCQVGIATKVSACTICNALSTS